MAAPARLLRLLYFCALYASERQRQDAAVRVSLSAVEVVRYSHSPDEVVVSFAVLAAPVVAADAAVERSASHPPT